MGFEPMDPRVRSLQREIQRITEEHEERVRRINRRCLMMKLLVLALALLALTGCAGFWGNVVGNWQGPCMDRCGRANPCR